MRKAQRWVSEIGRKSNSIPPAQLVARTDLAVTSIHAISINKLKQQTKTDRSSQIAETDFGDLANVHAPKSAH